MKHKSLKKLRISYAKRLVLGDSSSSPKGRKTFRVYTFTPNSPKTRRTDRFHTSPPTNIEPSPVITHKSPSPNSKGVLKKPKSSKKNTFLNEEFQNFIPSHLEVINRLKNITNLSKPAPFSEEILPISLRIRYLAYSNEDKHAKKSKEIIKSIANNPLLSNSQLLDEFLSRVKETERIIRQETEFLHKVRELKPKIRLNLEKIEEKPVKKLKTIKKHRNKTPREYIRSGLIVKE